MRRRGSSTEKYDQLIMIIRIYYYISALFFFAGYLINDTVMKQHVNHFTSF